MDLKGKKIGFGITGSFCTFDRVLPQIKKLINKGAIVQPILSYIVAANDTRFMTRDHLMEQLLKITGRQPITTIVDAEPIGPKKLFDLVIVAPCTGNTLAKLANGITDTPVLMACKSLLRNSRPVLLAVSTNDALGNNAKNIGVLINTKNIFLVPFTQDSPSTKQNSMVANMEKIAESAEAALEGRQIQPVIDVPSNFG